MPTPSILILGVYKPNIPADVYKEQWEVTGSEEQTNAHFKGLVLIEAVVERAGDCFKMTELGQPYVLETIQIISNAPMTRLCFRQMARL
jgi:hypothetical protein